MSYCAGCGNPGRGRCRQCGSWEFVDTGGLRLLRSVGRINPSAQMHGSSQKREAAAHGRYGKTGKVYSEEQVRQILRRQGYRV